MSRGRGRVAPAPITVHETCLQVLDMGLDFKSYQLFSTSDCVIGNLVSFPLEKIPDVFEPTVGLLVTLLHLYSQGNTQESCRSWLATYDIVQKLFLSSEQKVEAKKAAEDARRAVGNALASGAAHPDDRLCEKLLILLDYQSGIRGPQAPSQRRLPRDPKGTFCNLHLSDHKCNQEFACNQLHLHSAGPVKHRQEFYCLLVEQLQKKGVPESEIVHRLEDSLLFSRFGNKVTVKFGNGSVPFFKTAYTAGRLFHALRRHQTPCPGPEMCKGQDCPGIHLHDERNVQFTKPTDLPVTPLELARDLEAEAVQLVQLAETLKLCAANPSSPTSEQWRNTVRDYVRQSGIHEQQADEALLQSLRGATVMTPASSSEGFTPLLLEAEMKRFESVTE